MAKTNGDGARELVAAWSKAQKVVEDAQAKLEAARKEASKYSKAIYEALGTRPFAVKSLGRNYRAIHKVARKAGEGGSKRTQDESWVVIPLADNTPENEF